jgi:hypothetical protein
MTVTCDVDETRAIVLAGISLSYALAGMLKRAGVLDPEAIEDTFEVALSGVENSFAVGDASAALARQLLDLMGGQLAGPKPAPDQLRAACPQAQGRGGRPASASPAR